MASNSQLTTRQVSVAGLCDASPTLRDEHQTIARVKRQKMNLIRIRKRAGALLAIFASKAALTTCRQCVINKENVAVCGHSSVQLLAGATMVVSNMIQSAAAAS